MNVLAEIIEGVRLDLAERQEKISLDDLKARVARRTAPATGSSCCGAAVPGATA